MEAYIVQNLYHLIKLIFNIIFSNICLCLTCKIYTRYVFIISCPVKFGI